MMSALSWLVSEERAAPPAGQGLWFTRGPGLPRAHPGGVCAQAALGGPLRASRSPLLSSHGGNVKSLI